MTIMKSFVHGVQRYTGRRDCLSSCSEVKPMKKFLATLAGFFGGVGVALAEGDAQSSIDLSAAGTALTNAQQALSQWITTNVPTLAKILGAGLVITLVFVVYGWVRRAAKGR